MDFGNDDAKKTLRAKPVFPYYVHGLALGIPAILLGIQISGWIGIFPAIVNGHSDFRQLYAAAYMMRTGHGHQLYDYAAQKAFQDSLVGPEQIALPFLRPASQALLFAPLSLLPYRTAYCFFLVLNLGLLALAYRLLRQNTDHLAEIFSWLPAVMFLTFLPIAAALMQGQDSIELLVLFAAATAALVNRRELTAGALIGLGLFKFQIALPIAAMFLLWRQWRFVLGFLISAAVTSLVSIWAVGAEATSNLIRSLISISTGMKQLVGTAQEVPLRYATYSTRMPNLRGLIFNLADPHLSPGWIQFLVIALSVILVLGVIKRVPRQSNPVDLLQVAITTSIAVSYYLFIHDMAVILIPVVMTMNRFILAETGGDREGRMLVRISFFMFVAPVCMALVPSRFYLVSLIVLAFLFVLANNLGTRNQWVRESRAKFSKSNSESASYDQAGML